MPGDRIGQSAGRGVARPEQVGHFSWIRWVVADRAYDLGVACDWSRCSSAPMLADAEGCAPFWLSGAGAAPVCECAFSNGLGRALLLVVDRRAMWGPIWSRRSLSAVSTFAISRLEACARLPVRAAVAWAGPSWPALSPRPRPDRLLVVRSSPHRNRRRHHPQSAAPPQPTPRCPSLGCTDRSTAASRREARRVVLAARPAGRRSTIPAADARVASRNRPPSRCCARS